MLTGLPIAFASAACCEIHLVAKEVETSCHRACQWSAPSPQGLCSECCSYESVSCSRALAQALHGLQLLPLPGEVMGIAEGWHDSLSQCSYQPVIGPQMDGAEVDVVLGAVPPEVLPLLGSPAACQTRHFNECFALGLCRYWASLQCSKAHRHEPAPALDMPPDRENAVQHKMSAKACELDWLQLS